MGVCHVKSFTMDLHRSTTRPTWNRFGSHMGPYIDPTWIHIWFLCGPPYGSLQGSLCGSLCASLYGSLHGSHMDHIWITILILCGSRYGSSYVSTMDPHMDPIWIPIWTIYGPLYESYMSPYIYMDPHMDPLWMSVKILYGSYMDLIWIHIRGSKSV